ncbi:MAG: bifunctional 5,10-methylenetetrahydrofolate dehydrogenase/5,10-methenyltetrahydrofolate cyclohydrolase [bacterium]|nr:bifunctional 5,10-methylenetetrahydrofolate dehydrogenase/5,10-methenyltetrahydrofolate cyclohydrolase [bacterium]
MIINCTVLAKEWLAALAQEITAKGMHPRLGILLVGDDPGSKKFVARKEKAGAELGVSVITERMSAETDEHTILERLRTLSEQSDGVIVQLPLPQQGMAARLLDAVPPKKDIDGLSSTSLSNLVRNLPGFVPATVRGILHLLKTQKVPLKGAHVAVLGAGQLVGRPAALALLNRGATLQIIDKHEHDAPALVRQADIILVATGIPGSLGSAAVKPGALVLDAGFSVVNGAITGDADTHALDLLGARVTPVPGGLGALTVAGLYANLLDALRLDQDK